MALLLAVVGSPARSALLAALLGREAPEEPPAAPAAFRLPLAGGGEATGVDAPDGAATTTALLAADAVLVVAGDEETAGPFVRTAAALGLPCRVVLPEAPLNPDEINDLLAGTKGADGPVVFAFDRASEPAGVGLVLTGYALSGRLRLGDEVRVGDAAGRVRGLRINGQPVGAVERGRRASVQVLGPDPKRLSNTGLLTLGADAHTGKVLRARVTWARPPRPGGNVRVHVGATQVPGKVAFSPKDDTLVTLTLERPAMATDGQRILLLGRRADEPLAAGVVLAAPAERPKPREKREPVPYHRLPAEIVAFVGDGPDGKSMTEVSAHVGRDPQDLGDLVEGLLHRNALASFAGRLVSRDGYRTARGSFVAALTRLHAARPDAPEIPPADVVAEAGMKWGGKPLARLVAALLEEGAVLGSPEGVRAKGFRAQLPEKRRGLVERLTAALTEAGRNPVNPVGLSRITGLPPQAVREALKWAAATDAAVEVAPDAWLAPATLAAVREELRRLRRPFTAAEARDALATDRLAAIQMLEWMDRRGWTVRDEEDRRVVR